MAASRTGSPVLIDDVTADRGRGMNSEVSNGAETTGQHFIVRMDNGLKYTTRLTQGDDMEWF